MQEGDTSFDIMEGVQATDVEDGDSTLMVMVDANLSDTFDINKPGIYTIVYSVEDSTGNITNISCVITVEAKPIITHPGDVSLSLDGSFDPLDGLIATDAEDGDISSKIEVIENTVDVSKPGEYIVKY